MISGSSSEKDKSQLLSFLKLGKGVDIDDIEGVGDTVLGLSNAYGRMGSVAQTLEL